MPQLNPAPWFITFVTLWVVLLIVMQPRLLQLNTPPTPHTNPLTPLKPTWAWPWP